MDEAFAKTDITHLKGRLMWPRAAVQDVRRLLEQEFPGFNICEVLIFLEAAQLWVRVSTQPDPHLTRTVHFEGRACVLGTQASHAVQAMHGALDAVGELMAFYKEAGKGERAQLVAREAWWARAGAADKKSDSQVPNRSATNHTAEARALSVDYSLEAEADRLLGYSNSEPVQAESLQAESRVFLDKIKSLLGCQ